jgi:hypothetical protein
MLPPTAFTGRPPGTMQLAAAAASAPVRRGMRMDLEWGRIDMMVQNMPKPPPSVFASVALASQ